MPIATIDGIATRYEVVGSGPPLLMYAPGGFDATIEKWTTQSIYQKVRPVTHLSGHYRCITFDRRECGQSGGRLESVTWADYVQQGIGLLDHLGIEKAHLMGGCMGCSPVMKMAVTHPHRMLSAVLFWPVGGAKYRINQQRRFGEHLVFASQEGLKAVVRVASAGKPFGADPRGGPWASVILRDAEFAERFTSQNLESYLSLVSEMARTLIDRDTAPGAEPEDLINVSVRTMIVPGSDDSHATSAARYIQECIPAAQYWDVPVVQQTEAATSKVLLAFLSGAGSIQNL